MPLKKGDKVPDFKLYDTDKKERSLSEFLGHKTVLAFYPGAFTGACTKEMCALNDGLSMYNSLGAKVIGISVDSPFANKGFADANKITYTLLSDFSREVSKQIVGLYDNFGFLNGYTAAKRAILVLDDKGVVQWMWSTENPGDLPQYEEIEKALKAF